MSKVNQVYENRIARIILVLLLLLLIYNILNSYLKNKEYVIDLIYLKQELCIKSEGVEEMRPWWGVLTNKGDNIRFFPNEFRLEDLELSDIDFQNYDVIISQGRRINKLVYRKRTRFPYTIFNHSCIAYLENSYFDNTVFVYLVDKKAGVFVDDLFMDNSQYIIELDKK